MQDIINFLSFKSFISYNMLFVFYYLGSVGLPFFVFTYVRKMYKPSKEAIGSLVTHKYKIRVPILFIALFIFLEIIWRMMFEFLIAFLQIKDALVV